MPTLNTVGLSAAEIADRKAIEAAWVRYWDVTLPLLKKPKDEWRSIISGVAVEPLASTVLARTERFSKQGVDNYGLVTHHFYWGPSVAGADFTVVGDCMDTSKLGTLNAKTRKKLTVGIKEDNARIGFARGVDNIWRADNIQYLDAPC